jgi:serine protease Do
MWQLADLKAEKRKSIMKKLLLLLVAFSLLSFTANQTAVKTSWPRGLVANCLQNTSVIFGSSTQGKWLGSGVLISKDGMVLTAAHVVDEENIKALTMVTSNGNEYEVEVLLINRRTDLALVRAKASAQDFNYAKIQKSNELWVGESILVVGHPLGHFFTVTDGIIGSLPWSLSYFNRIIETNARILPGNSGGPVFTEKGEVIGIVSAMYITRTGEPTGIGIIIPIDAIHSLLKTYNALPRSVPIKRYKIGAIK